MHEEMAQTLVEFLRDRPVVDRVWMHRGPGRVDFWILTTPAAPDEVRPLYEANMILDQKYPTARFAVRVVNPAVFADPLFHFEPPPDSERLGRA